jgi:hypothetical protein
MLLQRFTLELAALIIFDFFLISYRSLASGDWSLARFLPAFIQVLQLSAGPEARGSARAEHPLL